MTEKKNVQAAGRKKIHIFRVPYFVALFIALMLGGFLLTLSALSPEQKINRDVYQAVYLSSGQLYFGKLQNTSGDYLQLKSPYIEQAVPSSEKNEDGTAKAPQTILLRVKDQVYGPDDSIAIKSSQVVFWQNLRPDSKVSQAIEAKSK